MPKTPVMGGGNAGGPKKTVIGMKSQLPKVVAVIETPVDIAVGAVDPRKRRVITSTRFSARTGADRRIFVSTHGEKAKEAVPIAMEEVTSPLETPTTASVSTVPSAWTATMAAAVAASDPEDNVPPGKQTHSRRSSIGTSYSGQTTTSGNDTKRQLRQNYPVDFSTDVQPVEGVWGALATVDDTAPNAMALLKSVEGLEGPLPKGFKGLATHDMNPMSFSLNHEKAVIGCSDGTI